MKFSSGLSLVFLMVVCDAIKVNKTSNKASNTAFSNVYYPTVCGVIGGVGPAATVDLFRYFVQGQQSMFRAVSNGLLHGIGFHTLREQLRLFIDADWSEDDIRKYATFPINISGLSMTDQMSMPLLVYNAPQIPDRTAFLKNLNGALDPAPFMINVANSLVAGGANCIAVPCNTAHAFLPQVRAILKDDVEVLDMLELTIKWAALRFHEATPLTLGILATTGTLQMRLYEKASEAVGQALNRSIVLISPLTVREGVQENVMEAIYGETGIKAGFDRYPCVSDAGCGEPNFELLYSEARRLQQNGAMAIIAGCTEIPLVLSSDTVAPLGHGMIVINPTKVLADNIVHTTLTKRKRVSDFTPRLV